MVQQDTPQDLLDETVVNHEIVGQLTRNRVWALIAGFTGWIGLLLMEGMKFSGIYLFVNRSRWINKVVE